MGGGPWSFNRYMGPFATSNNMRIQLSDIGYEWIMANSNHRVGLSGVSSHQENIEIWTITWEFWCHMKWVLEHIVKPTLSTSTHVFVKVCILYPPHKSISCFRIFFFDLYAGIYGNCTFMFIFTPNFSGNVAFNVSI